MQQSAARISSAVLPAWTLIGSPARATCPAAISAWCWLKAATAKRTSGTAWRT